MARIPSDALDAIERVLAYRARAVGELPGSEVWPTRTAEHHIRKALGHVLEWQSGINCDHETGEDPLAHAAARLLFALALRERRRS
jgi:hypothetical protein